MTDRVASALDAFFNSQEEVEAPAGTPAPPPPTPEPPAIARSFGEGFSPWRTPSTETPPTVDPIQAGIDEMFAEQAGMAKNNLANSSIDLTPDQAARAMNLARETGAPLAAFGAPDAFERLSTQQLVDLSNRKLEQAPAVQRALAGDPWLAKAFGDSVENLADIERTFNESGFGAASRKARIEQDRLADLAVEVEERAARPQMAERPTTITERYAERAEALPTTTMAARALLSGPLMATGQSLKGLAAEYDMVTRALDGVIRTASPGLADLLNTPLGELDSYLQPSNWLRAPGEAVEGISRDLRGDEESFVLDVIGAVGQIAAMVALRRMGGVQASNIQLQSQGAGIMEGMVEDDPAEAWQKDLAVVAGAGILVGTQAPVLEVLLGRMIAPVTNRMLAILARTGTGAVMEGGQEIVENLAMDLTRILLTNPDAEIDTLEALYEGAVGATAGGLVAGFIEVATGRRRIRQQQDAKADMDALQEILKRAAELNATKGPQTVESIVAQATDNGTVFIDQGVLEEAFAQAGMDPDVLPAYQAYLQSPDAQTQIGPGVEIPVSELAAYVAGTPAEQLLMQHVRRTADEPSFAESQTQAQKAFDFLMAEEGKILADVDRSEQFGREVQEIRMDIETQLTNARPDFGVQRNAAYSKLIGAFYATAAHRLGITPLQLRDGWAGADGTPRRGYRLAIQGETQAAPSLSQLPQATTSTFSRDGIRSLLETGGWTVLTAENPNAAQLSPEENAARNAQLEAELQAAGLEYVPVKGQYGNLENSFAVVGLDYVAAAKLGEKYGQESVLTRYGLVYPDGTVDRATGLTVHDTPPEDFFSTLPDGTTFSVDLEFNREPVGQVVAEIDAPLEGLAQSVNTRTPSAKAGRPDPHLATGLDVDFQLVESDPVFQKKLGDTLRAYPQLKITARNPGARLEQAVTQMVDNLRWLFERVPPEVRDRSRQWYAGGRVIIDRWVEKYEGKYSDAQIAGVLASMSPQLAWDTNVTLAERILDIYTDQQNTVWSPAMEATAGRIYAKTEPRKVWDAIRGKKLSEITDPLEQSYWIRAYDEAHNPRAFRQVTPEGGFGGAMRTSKGAETKAGWQNGHGPIASAVRILKDGSQANISRQLGDEHKVRNFYNNLFDPTEVSSVTIDTHAVAAALLSPLSGSSAEVLHNFGTPTSAKLGMSGTYVVYAEAYRRLAAEVGLLPREVQSIAWEAVRRMYTAPFKSAFAKVEGPEGRKKLTARAKDLQAQFHAIWKDYRTGKETADAARQKLLTFAGGIQPPGWVGLDTGLDAGAPDSSYTGEILGAGWTDRAARRGTGVETAQELAQAGSERLTRPPVNEDGTVTLWHWGKVPALSDLDPEMSGTGIAGADIRRRDSDPGNWVNRTYYGVAVGQPGGYRKESGLGANLYSTTVPFDRLYDMAADPLGLRPVSGELGGWDNPTSVFEKRIKAAGYAGYWVSHPQLGLTSAVFERMPVKPAEPPADTFAQGPALTGEDAQIAARFEDWAANDPGAVTDYIAKFGRKVDPDSAKTLSPEYVADPMRKAHVVHEGSSILAKRVYAHLLKTAPAGAGVVFSAGGGGSGKTEALSRIPSMGSVGVVYDSVLGNYDSAKSRIEQALASGRTVTIGYTNRPVMAAWRFALRRDRQVPSQVLANAHASASNTIRQLSKDYAGNDQVSIVVMNNLSDNLQDIGPGTIDDVYSYDYNKVLEDLVAEARRQYEQGQISEERFLAAVGQLGVGGPVGGQHQGGREGVQEDRRGVRGDEQGGVAEARGTGAPRQVDTPAFKKWFGDSKVVDENGEPRVVYHGTKADFTSFSKDRVGSNFGVDEVGFFFTSNPESASDYALRFPKVFKAGAQPNVVPAYLSLENPLTLQDYTWALATNPETEIDAQGISVTDFFDDFRRSIVAYAKEGGNDGVLFEHKGQMLAVAFEPTQIKSATGNIGTFDPADPSIVRQERRGAFAPSTLTLSLLADSDPSTFLHEAGHFFLTVYADMAAQPGTPAEVVQDIQTFLDNFADGASPQAWAAMSLDQQRAAHEAFAASFEQYLFEGKAPSKPLQTLFRQFSSWLKRVYRSIRDFVSTTPDAKLNPELAAIFDRMLATEAEIEAMKSQREYVALFSTAAEAGMSPNDFAAYLSVDADAIALAEETLRARSLRDMKWLRRMRNKNIRDIQKDMDARRAAVEAEVEAEVRAEPIYRAMEWLKRGKTTAPDGTPIEAQAGHRLAIDAVASLYPEGAIEGAPDWRRLGYGQYGMLGKEGLHPDMVAEMFGFDSGRALVDSLLEARPISEEVQGLADTRMLEAYGELNTPEGMAEAADAALVNDFRIRTIAAELSALDAQIGGRRALIQAAKEYAKQVVARKSVKQLRPGAYSNEAAKAARAATVALRKGDRVEAARQKRAEILNRAVAQEMHVTTTEVRALVTKLRKITKAKLNNDTAKTRDLDLLSLAQVLLSRYGLQTPKQFKAAREYVDLVYAYNPELGPAVEDILAALPDTPQDWRDLPIDGLREVAEQADQLWYLAGRTRRLELGDKKITIDEAREGLMERLEKRGIPDRAPGEGQAVTRGERWNMVFQRWLAKARRVGQWAEGMDLAPDGPWRNFVWHPVKDAADLYRRDRMQKIQEFRELFKTIEGSLEPGLITAPEIGYTFGKGQSGVGKLELLHAIMHTGNSSNRRKLLLGRDWAKLNEDGNLDSTRWDAFVSRMFDEGVLTKADMDFAQGVWDLLEGMKPGAQRAHRAVFGRYFSEITAEPVATPFGTYRGGYLPAAVDSEIVIDARLKKLANEENESMQYAFPSANKGFTQSRVEYNRPLALDLRLLMSHIDKVLIFTHLQPAVNDVHRLLRDPALASSLNKVDPGIYDGMLIPWLNRAAKQTVEGPSDSGEMIDGLLRAARTQTGAGLMFFNVINTLQQFTGIALAAVKVKPSQLGHGMAHMVTRPRETLAFIRERSVFMQERLNNTNALMYEQLNDLLLNPSTFQKARNWSLRNAYIFQIMADRAIAPVVWMGAYNQAIESTPDGMSPDTAETRARRIADSAVQETQMDQTPEGIAAFESGSAFRRLFTQFAGWFNMSANTMAAQVRTARGTSDSALEVAPRIAFVMFMGLILPGALSELIAVAMRGAPEDEDGDGPLDDWLEKVGWGTVKYGTAMVPFWGQFANAGISSLTGNVFDARMGSTPVVGAAEAGGRTLAWFVQLMVDPDEATGKRPGRIIRDAGFAINATTGLPANAISKPLGYWMDIEAGYVVPTSDADFVRGMITGTASPDSK